MMKNFCVFLAIILCCLPFVGAAEKKGEGYRLKQGDLVIMTIQKDSVETRAKLNKAGKATFPLIGEQKIQGLTGKEVEKKLKALYDKDYYVNAHVKIVVKALQINWVSVTGAVLNPGKLICPNGRKMTLPEAVTLAGGVLPGGDSRNITLAMRKGGNKKYDLNNRAECRLVFLDPGDTVVAPFAHGVVPPDKAKNVRKATVAGHVTNPGPVLLPRGGNIDVLTAIATAGGFDRIANKKTAILKRKIKNGFKTSSIDIRAMRDGRAKVAFLTEGDILIIEGG